MLTKAELDKILDDQKALTQRVEDAETKAKALEQEAAALARTHSIVGNRESSDENRCLKFFGVDHPKKLLGINVASETYRNVPEELKYMVLEFKKSMDIGRFVAQMFHGAPRDEGGLEDHSKPANIKNLLDTHYGRHVLAGKLKAWGSTVSGAGDEWVPTGVSSSYIEEYTLERALQQRFRTMPMPTNPFELPAMTSGTTARKATEGAAMTGANGVTTKLTLNAVKLAEYYELPTELEEDSAPDFLAMARDAVILAQKNAVETAMINGDDDGTHIDNDTDGLAANIAEKVWKGLRRQALANSANGGTSDFSAAVADETKLKTLRGKMGRFGTRPEQLIWIVPPVVYNQMLAMTNVSTFDKYGQNATVLQGALAAYQGIPIIASEFMRENLAATGVNTLAGPNTLTAMLLVNRTRWYLGQRRPIMVKLMQDVPTYDRWLLASYQRIAFVGHTQSATEVSVTYGINILK